MSDVNREVEALKAKLEESIRAITEKGPMTDAEAAGALGKTYLEDLKAHGLINGGSAEYSHRETIIRTKVSAYGFVDAHARCEYPDGEIRYKWESREVRHPRTYKTLDQGPHAPRRFLKQAARRLVGKWYEVMDITIQPIQPIRYFVVDVAITKEGAKVGSTEPA